MPDAHFFGPGSYGLQLLPEGQPKAQLMRRFEELVRIDLDHRIAMLDAKATQCAADLAAQRKAPGHPVDIRDTFIAGIAIARRATLATRNVRHFEDLPAPVVEPWVGGSKARQSCLRLRSALNDQSKFKRR